MYRRAPVMLWSSAQRGSAFLQKDFIKCNLCSSTQRFTRGYAPPPNPMLWDSDDQIDSYHNEQRMSTGYQGLRLTAKCEQCTKVHSGWRVVDFQTYIADEEAKEKKVALAGRRAAAAAAEE